MQKITRITLFSVILWCFYATALEKRQEFSIPLAKISVGTDSSTGKYCKAKIIGSDEKEQAIITGENDIAIKITKEGTEKTLFREDASGSYQISKFEAQEIAQVCKSFVQTLEIFERDLKDEKFDRVRYLDGYFPKFLKNFKIMLQLAQNGTEFRQINLIIPDTAYDVSLSSLKTDVRIKRWQLQKDYIIALRIAAKELIFQLKEWESKELTGKQIPDVTKAAKAEEILDLFINVYFGPPLTNPADSKKIENIQHK
jgi:hypothetical protein